MVLKRTKQLENKVNNFLDTIDDAGPHLVNGIKAYFDNGEKTFENYVNKLDKLEKQADQIRKNIETQLYEKTLIPESRGDVYALLEALDDIIDGVKDTIKEFDVEIPEIYEDYHNQFITLAEYGSNSIDEIVKSSRHFFNDSVDTRHYLQKVYYWEKEADEFSSRLKKKVFRDDEIEKLSKKFHYRIFIDHLDRLADICEDVADKLTIFSIKRSI